MKWNQETICQWSDDTFGEYAGFAARKSTRMNIEVAELLSEVEHGELDKAKVECADVYIVLVQVAKELGMSVQIKEIEPFTVTNLSEQAALVNRCSCDIIQHTLFGSTEGTSHITALIRNLLKMCRLLGCDLNEEVQKKMEINQKRKWVQLDEGRHQHV